MKTIKQAVRTLLLFMLIFCNVGAYVQRNEVSYFNDSVEICPLADKELIDSCYSYWIETWRWRQKVYDPKKSEFLGIRINETSFCMIRLARFCSFISSNSVELHLSTGVHAFCNHVSANSSSPQYVVNMRFAPSCNSLQRALKRRWAFLSRWA